MMLTLINVVLIAAILAFLLISGFKVIKFYRFLRSFTLPLKAGDPSPAAMLLDNAAHVVGKAAAMEIKTTLMGHASAASRQEQGIMSDIVSDSVNNTNPVLGTVLENFPSLKKRLGKNPALLSGLLKGLGQAAFTGGGKQDGHDSTDKGFGARRGIF